ncbi:rubredoxin domain-containing protein [Algivirga pacifica]|uniref:Rubredoxin-like domain-containing protein n=1 Tax=Algivirga pacifica TaxID=1162670 RepID=A0ABP9D5X6_9BACT
MIVQKKDLVRVFVKGGIISPGDLLKVITTAKDLGTDYIHFGSRQDILFPISNKNRGMLDETFRSIQTEYECEEEGSQNIVSSYTALDVMASTHWMAPHIYHYILDTFDYQPRLKINLVDPKQTMVPLFTGQVNFIASETENYWYCYVRTLKEQEVLSRSPFLIYSDDLCKVARYLEEKDLLQQNTDWSNAWKKLQEQLTINTFPVQKALRLPLTPFPYYEGMNRLPDGKYWLGLYWRNNAYDIDFLKVLCLLCQDTKIGKITMTPWKSFLVKGIDSTQRIIWEKLLGKYGLNVRHSSLELNWHMPVLDQEALELKNYLVRALDQQDISTYGLTFTVKTQPMILFTTVVIERALNHEQWQQDTYNILYAKRFDPNTAEYLYYAKGVRKEVLPALMVEVSYMYYEQLETPSLMSGEIELLDDKGHSNYQCPSCLTIYDEMLGDLSQGVSANTPFALLPETYECAVCGTQKEAFVKMSLV